MSEKTEHLTRSEALLRPRSRRVGVLIGGSGLIGGTLLHHFKLGDQRDVQLLAPNSKELSLRVPSDIRNYFERVRPDFIANCAIAAIDSDPALTFEVNCQGAIHLARAAQDLGIPYIHISSAAIMPQGYDVSEEDRSTVSEDMSNYARSKLLAELALESMRETQGLDYTIIRLAVVYGGHDHKINGFQRLLFALANRSMPVMLTRRSSMHSYTNARKLPGFVAHVLDHREEFSGETVHFADPEPVRLGKLMLTIKRQLGTKTPLPIYVPSWLAGSALAALTQLARLVSRLGIDARPPAERIFFRNFYESQVLSTRKLARSSWIDPDPGASVFTELPNLLRYYLPRWQGLNLVDSGARARGEAWEPEPTDPLRQPTDRLLASLLADQEGPFLARCAIAESGDGGRRSLRSARERSLSGPQSSRED